MPDKSSSRLPVRHDIIFGWSSSKISLTRSWPSVTSGLQKSCVSTLIDIQLVSIVMEQTISAFHWLSLSLVGQPGEDLTFEASAPFWAEDPTTVRPILGNKRRPWSLWMFAYLFNKIVHQEVETRGNVDISNDFCHKATTSLSIRRRRVSCDQVWQVHLAASKHSGSVGFQLFRLKIFYQMDNLPERCLPCRDRD